MSFVRHTRVGELDQLEIIRISGSVLIFVSQKSRNGLSESGLSIAAPRCDFAGDGLVAAASSMSAVCPSPSVMRGASPMTLYGPKVADWG